MFSDLYFLNFCDELHIFPGRTNKLAIFQVISANKTEYPYDHIKRQIYVCALKNDQLKDNSQKIPTNSVKSIALSIWFNIFK